jgi:death-on-curing protein
MRRYLTVAEILAIHKTLIDHFGGLKGVRDMAALQSAVGRFQTGYYKDIIEESAALMEILVNNHPFLDGNKRISFFATDVFLRMNDRYIDCDNEEAYRYVMGLFKHKKYKFKELQMWLRKNVKVL